MQSAVLAMIDSVCLSVRLSHARIMSKRFKLRSWVWTGEYPRDSSFLTVNFSAKFQREHRERGRRRREGRRNRQFLANKSPYLTNGARSDHSHNDRLIGSRIRAFDWYQNYRSWMTSNCQSALWCRKDASFGAYCTNLNKDRPILSAAKMYAND